MIGFVLGMIANGYLLKGISRDKYINDKSLRLRYGLLNWGVALLGLGLGLAFEQTKH